MILVIDNYDSFTYNIVQYLGEMGADQHVVRNRAITLDEIAEMRPEKILISPGPCTPNEAGVSVDVIKRFGPEIPILGVCLGHQSIATALGGNVVRADRVMHGKTSLVHHDGAGVFEGLPNPMEAIRYHSLLIERASLPDALTVSAETDQGEIMGVRHKDWPLEGVQFHPESILTQGGKELLRNFLLAGQEP